MNESYSMGEGTRIKLADPCVGKPEEDAVLRVLRSGRLVAGPRVEEFEGRLASFTGRAHAVAVSSGTAALLAAMESMDVGPGSVVIVPAFTFPAPAIVAAFLGAEVRVCDVDPATFNISPDTLSSVFDDDVSLVVAIDQFGVPSPVIHIEDMLRERGIPVLVDAACSLGSTLEDRPCGSFGKAATFSFHPRKVITTGEGGAVLTDDDNIAARVRRFRNIGMEDGGFLSLGLNLRPSEIGAAIGLCQLDRIEDIVARRRVLARRYRALGLDLQSSPDNTELNHQTLAATLPMGADRAALISSLADEGVEAQVASYCLGSLPRLVKRLNIDDSRTPVAKRLHNLGMALPMHEDLKDADVDYTVGLVHDWLKTENPVK